MTRRPRIVAVVAAILLAMFLMPAPAGSVENVTATRVFGVDRTDTAAQTARLAFPDGTSTAVVATSGSFQDALAGAGLAGARQAAQLLVRPDEVPSPTQLALDDLGVEEVLIVGNDQAVSNDVSDQLATQFEVTRIAGDTPEATAAAVAGRVVNLVGYPSIDGDRTVLLSSVDSFADSLAGSAPVYAGQVPLLYTEPDQLSLATREYLAAEPVQRAVVLGGTGAVSPGVEGELGDLGITVQRLSGPTRVETAMEVATFAEQQLGFDFGSLMVARGDEFPDALTAAQYGGSVGDVILLTATPTLLPATAAEYIRLRCPEIELVRGVGGVAALSEETLADVEAAAESCAFGGDAEQIFVFDQFAQEAEAPQPLGVALDGRTDGQPFTGPVDLALFPCGNIEITDDDADVFTDADNDRLADGYGQTDTGRARILFVEGEDIDDATQASAAVPGADGDIDITVGTTGADCAVVVAVNGDGDGRLTVGSLGTAVENYGLAVLRFTPDADR